MHETLHLVNGSDSTSVECPSMTREVPGSDTAAAGASSSEVCTKLQILFYKLRTMNYSKSRTKIGCQKTQLEIVEDLDNDFPVQYGTELYRKIIIQVPLEV